MKLMIKFKQINEEQIVEVDERAGLDFLDLFLEENPKYETLDFEKIKYTSSCYGHTCQIKLNIEEARLSERFGGTDLITVKVRNDLSKFLKFEIDEYFEAEYVHNNLFGIIPLPVKEKRFLDEVSVRQVLDERLIIKTWIEEGSPLIW